MATKRTDAFDVYASEKERRDAEIRALKLMSPHSTLKGMGRSVAPLVQAARGTVPPPVSIQDQQAEVLVAAETQVTRNPLFADDLNASEILAEELVNPDDVIELIEESGLLVLDADQSPDEAIEVSSSFLVEELDGFPEGLETAEIPDLSALTDDIEEITSNHLAYVETRGEIVEVETRDLPKITPIADEVPLISRHNLYHESAEYSDGVPRLRTNARGLSSKTLRVPAPKSKSKSTWLAKAAIGMVFAAGIGAGVAFALHSAGSTEQVTATASTPEPTAATPVAAAAEEATPPVAAAAPVVAQLDQVEAQDAIEASLEPTVEPLQVQPLEAQDEAVSASEEDLPVVTALPMEPSSETEAPTPRDTSPQQKPAPASKAKTRPVKKPTASGEASQSERTSAVISTEKATSPDPGVLMLAAKPPCEIRIDGKSTGLTTPQRVLTLPPGKHRITLTNQEHQIKDSFKVSIVSGKKTRIVRDNTSKIK